MTTIFTQQLGALSQDIVLQVSTSADGSVFLHIEPLKGEQGSILALTDDKAVELAIALVQATRRN